MARLFLTNIDLNTNELQNAVIQNLSSAPLSGNKEGRIYYDVTAKALYLYTDGQWKPLASGGAAASSIELTGDVTGTANVDPATGKLTVSTTVDSSFVTKTGTQSLSNKTIQGPIYFQSGGGAGASNNHIDVDNSTGKLVVESGYALDITASNDINITSGGGDIVLNADGNVYKTSVTAGNRLATIDDLTNVTLNVVGTADQITVNDVAGTTTISLPNNVNIADRLIIGGSFAEDSGTLEVKNGNDVSMFTVDTAASPMDQYHGYNTYTNATGVANLNAFLNISSEGAPASGYLFMNVYGASTNPTLHLESKGDLALRAGADGNDGNIILYTGNTSSGAPGKAYIGWNHDSGSNASNQIATIGDIDSNKYITAVDSNVFNVDSGTLQLNSVVEASGTEVHITKLELHQPDGTNNGVVMAHPSDGSLTVAATGWLHLESHDGGINIDPDNGQTTFSNQVRIDSNGTIETNSSDLTLAPDTGNVFINNSLYVDTVSSKNSGGDTLYLNGGNSSITLDGDTGNINFNPNGLLHVYSNATFEHDVTIAGNLNVQGTLNAVNRTEINIEDNTIRLNTGFTGTPVADAGIIVERGTANSTAIIWSESNKDWTLTNDGSNYYAIARKFVSMVGDASNTSFDVVHNLGTRDITVMVRENNSEYNVVETDVLMKDGNTVTIRFTDAPALNAYKVIIIG